MFIDTHAHLQFENYTDDLQDTVQRAFNGGLTHMINVGTNLEDCLFTYELTERFDGIYGAVGLHPNDSLYFTEETFNRISAMADSSKIVAIGEIGLDYYRDRAPKDHQKNVFRLQLGLAAEKGLPVIIHTRNSFEDTIKIVQEYKGKLTGVFHCFSYDENLYKSVIDTGFIVSFTGNITYSKKYAKLLSLIEQDTYMIETDCPFMTPVPHRGKRNEPLYVRHVAEHIASVRQASPEEIGRQTSATAKRLFNLP